MKQIWPNYSYSPATNVLTLTGLNIDRDQLLLVTAADRGRIMYNFADSSVTASAFTSGANTALTLVATTAGLTTTAALVIYYDDQVAGISGTVTANGGDFAGEQYGSLPTAIVAIAGWDSVNAELHPIPLYSAGDDVNGYAVGIKGNISGTVTANFGGNSRMMGTVAPLGSATTGYVSIGADGTPIGSGTGRVVVDVVNQGGASFLDSCLVNSNAIRAFGTVTIGAGTAQIGSVTASISGTIPISISSVTIGNSITIGSCVTHGVTISNTSVTVNGTFYQATQPVSLTTLPALVAGTAQIGSVTASISNNVVTFYPMQGTSVSNTNFTSLTSSTSLVSAVANRQVLTVFNEAGNLHISAGATCTTISYQVRLSAGDYWECPQGQLSLAHTAVFATAGTARVSQVS
jgi:hypothetical protein